MRGAGEEGVNPRPAERFWPDLSACGVSKVLREIPQFAILPILPPREGREPVLTPCRPQTGRIVGNRMAGPGLAGWAAKSW